MEARQGDNVTTTIFGDFHQFSAKVIKTNSAKCCIFSQIFRQFFQQKYFQNHNIGPQGHKSLMMFADLKSDTKGTEVTSARLNHELKM
jgi:hypothetical protein